MYNVASLPGWVMDPILFHNKGIRLMYEENKQDGRYIEIEPDKETKGGKITLGTFEGAGPFITDAMFIPLLTLSPDKDGISEIIVQIAAFTKNYN